MHTIGTFTFTIGEPIRLQGFSDGAAVSWAQDKGIHKQLKNKIEEQFDVFSDETYPYDDYYQYVEEGFLQGITDAESVNQAAANWAGLEAVAALSTLHRVDLDQDVTKITNSYLKMFENHPSALSLLSEAGIAIGVDEKSDLAALKTSAEESNKSQDT